MAQDKKKSAAQIAGENEVLGAPDKPDPDFAAEMQAQQDSVDAAFRDDIMFEGKQDPNLRGTGQPGELYMTPGSPEFEEKMQELEGTKNDLSIDPFTKAKREAANAISPSFNGMFWLNSISPDFEIKPFSPSVVAKKMMEEE